MSALRPRGERGAALAAALVGLVACACGGAGDGPGWVRLACPRGTDGTLVLRRGPRVEARERPGLPVPLSGAAGARLVADEDGRLWLDTELVRSAWTPREGPLPPGDGEHAPPRWWEARLPAAGVGRVDGDEGPRQRLEGGGRSFRYLFARGTDAGGVGPGAFYATRAVVRLLLAADEEPPTASRLRVRVAHGRYPEAAPAGLPGVAGAGASTARVTGRRFSGEGLSVWPGTRVEWSGTLPEDARLSFAACVEPGAPHAEQTPLTLRVRRDGATLFEEALRPGAQGAIVRRALELDGGRATLSFEADGDAFAYGAFLDPFVCAAGAEKDPRPDLVVFLADTFRADNLAAYGGTLELPNLERFLAGARVFRNAWSTSTWTLPAHASLFAGRYPRELGAAGLERGLPPVDTVAALLADAGYRTAAVTDAGLVSSAYGLERGFQVFDELQVDLDSTLARARAALEAGGGDPRPLFLFVQSYATHSPYAVSDATRAARGDELGLDFPESEEELFAALGGDLARPDLGAPGAPEALAKLLRLHRASAVDLDRAFGALRDELEERGLLRRGVLVFASDHGESFGEHGRLTHRGPVWDVEARVPLALGGGGLAPGLVDTPASLVDLPPTLLALAGLEPPEGWDGASLLALPERRTLYGFECAADPARSTLAVVEWPRKLIATEDPAALREGELVGAFDLAQDPGELHDLAAQGEAWPERLLRRRLADVLALLTPAEPGERAAPDPTHIDELRGLGYAGEGATPPSADAGRR